MESLTQTTYLDTHVLVWLAGQRKNIPTSTLEHIKKESELRISPMVLLELAYLHEINRIAITSAELITHLEKALPLKVCPMRFELIATHATTMSWTRDPFDRLITAQAAISSSVLITRDETIHTHYSNAFWS